MPVEYSAGREGVHNPQKQKATRLGVACVLENIGAGERNRTLDLLITNELLYRLSYTGEAKDYTGFLEPCRPRGKGKETPSGSPGMVRTDAAPRCLRRSIT